MYKSKPYYVYCDRINNIVIHGTPYKCGSVVRLKTTESEPNQDFKFQYAQIKEIYVYKDHKIILTNKIRIISICPHIRAFKVAVTEQELLARLDSLYCYGVLHLKQYENDQYLIEKDNWTKPMLYD